MINLSSAPYRVKPYPFQFDSAESIHISNIVQERGAEMLAAHSKNHNRGKEPESSTIYVLKLIDAV